MQTDLKKNKCVLVINPELPLGLIANTAMILGLTIGNKTGEFIGSDVVDASGQQHLGITTIPIPILKGTKEKLTELMGIMSSEDYSDLLVVDFSNVAQMCLTYDDYISKAAATPQEEFEYLGIGVYGDSKKVTKLTGSLPLLR
ncbi:MAG: DUF2000 domain-containing protein [Clostridia bacterium]|nr:DUF2000 domain-containing protein [Clostridia bacterium]